MRLKTKLVLAITSLVFFLAGILSLVYVSQLVHEAVQQSYDSNKMVADAVRFAVQDALENGLKGITVDPNDPAQLRAVEITAIRNSVALQAVMDSVNRYSLTVYDINVGDNQGRILASTNPDNQDKLLPVRSNYGQLLQANPIALMRAVFGPPRVFDITAPLVRNGQPFITVHVGARTTLLHAVYAPWMQEAFTLMGFTLVTALVIAFLLSNLALRPLEEISMQLSYWTPVSEEGEAAESAPKQDMPQRVSTQIERIGQRMRNVEEVFSALQENLDQILGKLQDGILLFTGDGRAALVSESARRFLQVNKENILGLHAREIFDQSTELGRKLMEAFEAGVDLYQKEIMTEPGRRIEASVNVIHDDRTSQKLGALVTLHDPVSVEQIESELELSRRMAAIGRLTSGVGHEVKNPINAIVVHLELLKNKLGDTNEAARRHLEVIEAEIRRLDRVVQTLVDFSRPVELQLREHDLRRVIGDVLALSGEELSTRNVILESQMPPKPLMAYVDADLMKQAVLNVIQNGAQAMSDGGHLHVSLTEDRKMAVLRIRDEGPGIPEEIRGRIFDLYFTTKAEGSGIGLAMTYRILQLHHGSVDVQSETGHGTEVQMRIPLALSEWGRKHLQAESAEGSERILQ